MAFAISASGTRTSSTVTVPITYALGDLPTVGNDSTDSFFLPVTFSEYAATPFTLTGQTLVSGGAVFTPSALDVVRLRVGDIISSLTAGTVTIPVPATFTRPSHVYHGQNFIVLTGSTVLPRDGDAVSGTGIGAAAVVTRVETATRTVYLSVVSTESSLLASPVTVTFTPAVRIISIDAVTRVVTLNGNFAGTGTSVSGSVVFTPAAFEAVAYYLQCTHVGSTVDRLNVSISAFLQTGALAFDATGTGTDQTTIATVSPSPIGAFFLDLDAYFTAGRKPKTNV